jgi:hypothetical protein
MLGVGGAFGCGSVPTSASRHLNNLREAEVASASNSALAVPSKSVLLLKSARYPAKVAAGAQAVPLMDRARVVHDTFPRQPKNITPNLPAAGRTEDGTAGELAAVVADHRLLLATLNYQPLQLAYPPVSLLKTWSDLKRRQTMPVRHRLLPMIRLCHNVIETARADHAALGESQWRSWGAHLAAIPAGYSQSRSFDDRSNSRPTYPTRAET